MPALLADRVLFGAAYYLEYQRSPDLERDLDTMIDAGFTVIRVGESVWSTWEPEDGVFDLDWMQAVLDAAHARGISVILGTPTYAIPMWLARKHPEIAGQRETGRLISWGARQEADFTHPAYRFHAERVVRAIMARYADHPSVIGFQVDNEPGNEILHNHGVFQRFTDELRHRYVTVDRLNEEWGLAYWSHRLSTWADLWTPDNNTHPQYDLAWRRFQAELTTEMLAWQRDVVREYAAPEQFITTCLSYDRPALQDDSAGAVLDVTSGNPYYRMQHHLELPDPADLDTVQTWYTTGAWTLYRTADRMWSTKQAPFLVTETGATSIWGSSLNEPPYRGQLRQAAWAFVSRGAAAIEYWHWHSLPYGAETYWGGVLPHSGQPGRIYAEIQALGAELANAGSDVLDLVPDADLGILYSTDSKWGMAFQPPFGLTEPDPRSYERIVDGWYRAAFDAHLQVRVQQPRHLFARDPRDVVAELPALVVPGFYIASDEQLDWLREYAHAGGHLLLGIRTGYADEEARPRTDRQPARLADAAGVSYDEFSNAGDTVVLGRAGLPLPEGAVARLWIDGLKPDTGTEVLFDYEHPHFSEWAPATTREHGDGRITVIGTQPDPALGAALLRWAVPRAANDKWIAGCSHPESVRVTGGSPRADRSAGGVRFVHNYSWQAATLVLPVACEDLAATPGADGRRQTLPAGHLIELQAWDARVLRETTTH
ncbi:beta-galactosidase [Rathayibacter caricis DSM 15933]|uniref:beta-galactosidase n=1 Tax=Rathayibacter caricis DSM 15933 TaxID=1328867 RepID=A0A2T4UNV5_9MICO|nr:beta-galactosidase [Rathayibacter caricis]PTL71210.1 beta-galactosidase [Rathayibacter caricis DSM 15933]